MKLNIGDVVIARQGTTDPEFKADLSGFVGRIEEIEHFEKELYFYYIAWDSVTIAEMNPEFILKSEEKNVEWDHIYLMSNEVKKCKPRDSEKDVEITKQYVMKKLFI